jgi:hypothetical protein
MKKESSKVMFNVERINLNNFDSVDENTISLRDSVNANNAVSNFLMMS